MHVGTGAGSGGHNLLRAVECRAWVVRVLEARVGERRHVVSCRELGNLHVLLSPGLRRVAHQHADAEGSGTELLLEPPQDPRKLSAFGRTTPSAATDAPCEVEKTAG